MNIGTVNEIMVMGIDFEIEIEDKVMVTGQDNVGNYFHDSPAFLFLCDSFFWKFCGKIPKRSSCG